MSQAQPFTPAMQPRWGAAFAVEDLCFYTVVGLTLAGMVLAPFRYLAYGTPYLCLIAMLTRNRVFLPREIWSFLLLAVIGILAAPWAADRGIKDLYFIVSGISIGLAFGDRRISLRIVLVLMMLGHLAAMATQGRALSVPALSVLESYSSLESSFSFLFGLVAVAALGLRRRWLALFAMIAAVVALKRIVLAAILACVMVWLLPERLRRMVLSPPVALIVTWAYLMIAIAFTQGAFDTWMKETLGLSANAFTMGRQHMWGAAVEAIQQDLPRYMFFGDGPGAGYAYLLEGTGRAGKANLHSDILKIFIEYGGIVLSVFLVLLYSARSSAQRLLALYTHLLLFTDNVLIYHFYLFFYVLMCRAVDPLQATGKPLVGRERSTGVPHA